MSIRRQSYFCLTLIVTLTLTLLTASCSSLRVIRPEQQKNVGTVAVDWSGGTPKIVETYTCSLVASNGKRVSAVGKFETEAQQEALAKCRDETLISFCLEKNVTCSKN